MVEVSVITAAHNSESVIERNIRSVGTQTLNGVEHIIIDDGSIDDTATVAEGLQREFPGLRVVRQAHGGAAKARNAGIELASGRYIAFLDSDDAWTAGKLEAQVAYMAENGVVFSFGDYDAVDGETGTELGRYEAPVRLEYADLLRGCPIGCLTVAYDQTVLGKRFMPDVKRGQDWGLWLELTRDGTVGHRYPGCFARYSRGGDTLSASKLRKALDLYTIYRRQERIGAVRALCYLFPHVLSALGTRPVR